MNRILFESQAALYTLDRRDPRFEHVRGVLRLGVGDVFDVGVINGPAGKAVVEELGAKVLKVRVDWGERLPEPPPIDLLVGLCRPATVRKILTTVPTLGVRQLLFVASGRSDPAYGRSRIWREGEWRERLIEGVEQSFGTFLPEVRLSPSLKEGLAQLPSAGCRLALDVYEGTASLSSSVPSSGPVVLAVGPERGWNGADRKELREAGFELVSAGRGVLRVETAVVVGLGAVLGGLGLL